MPLSSPAGGAASSGLIANGGPLVIGARLRCTNVGITTSDNYSRAIFSPFSERIFVGFSNAADGLVYAFDNVRAKGEPFVNVYLAAANLADININYPASGGLLVQGGVNQAFRSDTEIPATAIWTNITPPAATSRDSLFSLRNNSNLYIQTTNLTLPDRNIEISADQGLTWDSDPGANIGFATGTGSLRTPIVGPGGNVFGCSNAGLGITSFGFIFNPSLGIPDGTGVNSEINNLPGTMGTGDFNTAGTVFVTQSNAEVVVITPTGFTSVPAQNNPFVQDNSVGELIVCIKFSPILDGWIFIGDGTVPVTCGFMSSDDLTEIIAGDFVENGAVLAVSQQQAHDVNGDVIAFGNAITCARTSLFT